MLNEDRFETVSRLAVIAATTAEDHAYREWLTERYGPLIIWSSMPSVRFLTSDLGADDIVLLHVRSGKFEETLVAARRSAPDARIIVILEQDSPTLAEAALEAGAFDALAKPLSRRVLVGAIARARAWRPAPVWTETAPPEPIHAPLPDIAIPEVARALVDFETAPGGVAPFWVHEQRIIETALAAYNGHVGRAAAALEIAPSTIYRKMQSWQGRLDQ